MGNKSSKDIYSPYQVLSTLHRLTLLIHTIYDYLRFTDEATESQRSIYLPKVKQQNSSWNQELDSSNLTSEAMLLTTILYCLFQGRAEEIVATNKQTKSKEQSSKQTPSYTHIHNNLRGNVETDTKSLLPQRNVISEDWERPLACLILSFQVWNMARTYPLLSFPA